MVKALQRCLLAPVAALGLAMPAPVLAQDYAIIGISLFDDLVTDDGGKDGASADFNGEFDFVEGRICYYLELTGLPDATGASIHRGGRYDTSAQLIALPLPDPPDDEICVDADPALLREMAGDPDEYYMIVTSPGHADGAVRGQLSD